MTAIFVTVWLLFGSTYPERSSIPLVVSVPNIANEASCHTLAVSLGLALSRYQCRKYEAVIGTTDHPRPHVSG